MYGGVRACDDTPVVVVCVHSHKYWLLITSRLIGWLAGWWVWQAKHWRNSWFGSVVISQSLRDAKPLWAIVCGGGVYFHAITNNKSFFALFFSSDVDEYGFKRPENFDYKSYEQFMSNYLKTLAKRRKKWEAILEENTDLTNVNPKLKRFIRKGIPGNT